MNKVTKLNKMKATKTKVSRRNGHDNISVSAKFTNGENFRFSVGRTGNRISIGFINGTQKDVQEVSKWLKLEGKETYGECMDRLQNALKQCNAGAEFMNYISKNK